MTQRTTTSLRRFLLTGILLATTLLASTVDALDCYPLQISLLPVAQIVPKEKSVCGLRLDLPWGENKSVSGIDLGIVNRAESVQGIEIGGVNWLAAEDRNMSWGIQAGVFNVTGTVPFTGVQLGFFNLPDIFTLSGYMPSASNAVTLNIIQASLANASMSNLNGVQVAFAVNGALNVNGLQASIFLNGSKDLNGIQFSYFRNMAEGTVNGIQAGIILGNFAQNLNGMQIGLLNGAEAVNGVQIGVINMCANLRGVQLGVINILAAKQSSDAKSFFKDSSYYPLIRIGY
jgi:hypothetical protein